jgi:ferredoxin
MAKRVNQARCIQCGECLPVCPNGGISEVDGNFIIASSLCTECCAFASPPSCEQICPTDAICNDADNHEPVAVLAARAADRRPDLFPKD